MGTALIIASMTDRLLLGDAAGVLGGSLKTFKAGDTTVAVARVRGRYCAVDYKCPLVGRDLGRRRFKAGAIVCLVHPSRLDLCTDEVLDWAPNLGSVRLPGFARRLLTMGMPPAPVKTHPVELDGGKLYLAG